MESPTPQIPTVKKSGYMEKRRRNLMMSWRQYWFVLDGKLLMYYRTKEDYKNLAPCKGSINLGLAQVVRPTHGVIRYPIEIITRTKKVYLATREKDERLLWVQVLQEALELPHTSPRNSIVPGNFKYSQEDISNQRVSMISSCDLNTKKRTDNESDSSSSGTLPDIKPGNWDKANLRNGSTASNSSKASGTQEETDTLSRIRKQGGYSIHNNNMGIALQLNEALAKRARKFSEAGDSESPEELRKKPSSSPSVKSPLSQSNDSEKENLSSESTIKINGTIVSSPKSVSLPVTRSSKKGRAPAIPRSQNVQKLVPPEELESKLPTPKPRRHAPSSHVNSSESLASSTGSQTESKLTPRLRERSQSHDILNKTEEGLKKACNNSSVYLNAIEDSTVSGGSIYVSDATHSMKNLSISTDEIHTRSQNVKLQWCSNVKERHKPEDVIQKEVAEKVVKTLESQPTAMTSTCREGERDIPPLKVPIILEPVNEEMCVQVRRTSQKTGKIVFTTPVQVIEDLDHKPGDTSCVDEDSKAREAERRARLSFALPQEVFFEAEFCNEFRDGPQSNKRNTSSGEIPADAHDMPNTRDLPVKVQSTTSSQPGELNPEAEEEDEDEQVDRERKRLLDLHLTLKDLRSSGIDHLKQLLDSEDNSEITVQTEGRINKLGYSAAVTQLKQKCSEAESA